MIRRSRLTPGPPAPASWHRVRRGLLEFLLPASCLGCGGWMGSPSGERRFLCPGCAARIRKPPRPACSRCEAPRPGGAAAPPSTVCPECEAWPPVIRSARSAALLLPPADDLVHALKYGGWPEAAEEMVRGMVGLLPRSGPEDRTLLVPVPTTPERARRRGYNQAGILAHALARRGGGIVSPALVRTRATGSQVALHREERMANVSGAFECRDAAFSGLSPLDHVVLVDDVLTTGATASAAALALEEGGVGSVHLVTYGRARPEREGGAAAPAPSPDFFQNWLRSGGKPRATP
jgi:ComF family protein